jgi:hypothetical protein
MVLAASQISYNKSEDEARDMSQNALVRLIYEAVDDPLVWDAFLTKFAEAVHAETAGLCTEDKAGLWGRNLATSAKFRKT